MIAERDVAVAALDAAIAVLQERRAVLLGFATSCPETSPEPEPPVHPRERGLQLCTKRLAHRLGVSADSIRRAARDSRLGESELFDGRWWIDVPAAECWAKEIAAW
jgi:hypothetical protein